MLKAECPYIPPRSEIEGEADFLHASSEDVLVGLLSSVARLLLSCLLQLRSLAHQEITRHTSFRLVMAMGERILLAQFLDYSNGYPK